MGGLLFDDKGERLTGTHAVKSGRRYRYYVTAAADGAGADANGSALRIAASEIEPVVVRQLASFLGRPGELIDDLQLGQLEPEVLKEALAAAVRLAAEVAHGSAHVRRQIVQELVERVTVGSASVTLLIKRQPLAARLLGDTPPPVELDGTITIEAPIRVARRGVETKLVIAGPEAGRAPDQALIEAVARGHVWFDDLVTGRAKSVHEIARREGLTDRYVARLLDLAFLQPALVEEILEGRQPVDMTAEKLSRAERPLLWPDV